MCKGCTICVTGCPVEAIRVRDGKAHILEERCIDCGECIRRCPNKAKYACSSELDELKKYDLTAALLTPSIYGQFNLHYSAEQIHEAVKSLGFTEVYDVSVDALEVSRATADLINHGKNLPKPLISSSCPTVLKLIQVRFPSLLENILPLLPPVEVCARRARKELEARADPGQSVGVFLISPCPAKITVARSPVGYETTAMNGAISFVTIYLNILEKLRNLRDEQKKTIQNESEVLNIWANDAGIEKDKSAEELLKLHKFHTDSPDGIAWGRESGEAEYIAHFLEHPENFSWITTCGLSQILETLEAIEDGQLSDYDFAEIEACAGGCLGGPLAVKPLSESGAILRNRLRHRRLQAADLAAEGNGEILPESVEELQNKEAETPPGEQRSAPLFAAEFAAADRATGASPEADRMADPENKDAYRSLRLTQSIFPRPARQLSTDFSEARKMMAKLEEIAEQLPGTDCGSCGAPNCRALAEDIVRKKAKFEDCVVILKERYEGFLFGDGKGKKGHIEKILKERTDETKDKS
jgi:iron only hydrogenase large subunit-like protein